MDGRIRSESVDLTPLALLVPCVMDLQEIQQLVRYGNYEVSFHAQQERLEGQRHDNLCGCSYCGGEVTEKKIDHDYRRQSHLLVISNVPAGVCGQCSEKYFKPGILKKMDDIYHDIFDRNQRPQRMLTVPNVSP